VVAPELEPALVALHARLVATRRRRSRVEAPMPLTMAYDFLFAIGHARLGGQARARELAAGATAALAGVAGDPRDQLRMSEAPVELALPHLARLADHFGLITDALGTNTHFCMYVLQFVDALVCGFANRDC
jgi:hypothetical protein